MSLELVDPADPSKPISEAELYTRAINGIAPKIKDIPENEDGEIRLRHIIAQLESISFEARSAASHVASELRKRESKSGRNRWDKAAGEVNRSNRSLPSEKKLSKALTPLQTLVKRWMDMEDQEVDIEERDTYIVEMSAGKKYTEEEVRLAIKFMRER